MDPVELRGHISYQLTSSMFGLFLIYMRMSLCVLCVGVYVYRLYIILVIGSRYLFLDATIGDFCEVLNDFCGRAEISSDDRDEIEWLSLSVADVRTLVNEIVSVRPKNVLHLVPIDILMRLLKVLNHQIHRAEGLSVSECDHVGFPFYLSSGLFLLSVISYIYLKN